MRAPSTARCLYAWHCDRTRLYPLYACSAIGERTARPAGERRIVLYSSLFMSAVIMIVAAGVGFLLGYIGQRVATQRLRRETEERTRHLLHEAEKEAESKKREASLEAQASWYQAKAGIEQQVAATKLELQDRKSVV